MDHPQPDTKNWTWVLERRCPECGFDGSTFDRSKVAGQVRSNAAAWRGVLGRGEIVSQRPPTPPGAGPVWSALEYGAHVRDVYKLACERLALMLDKESPTFADWNQDAHALDHDYASEDANKVSYDLAINAGKFADMLDRVRGSQWDRPGRRSDGSEFKVETFAIYLLHDPVHHLADVEKGYEAIADASN